MIGWLGINLPDERGTPLKRRLRDEMKVLRYTASQQPFFLQGEYEQIALEVMCWLFRSCF